VPPSLAGIPGLSLPIGFAKPEDESGEDCRLPVGLHMLAAHQNEETLFKIAHVLEQAIAPSISQHSPQL
jgi:Asp-tRNA(Asn)/Glu-tRNA(Gln) amidotransferase A subunit family amidase